MRRTKKEENLDLLKQLECFVKNYYDNIRKKLSERELKNELSNTLITKILMGTLGCVPAYDRYFIDGIKKQHISTGNYNSNSLRKLIDFYETNAQTFEPVINQMKIGNIPYPEMSEDEQLKLLATDGMLVKRPLLIGDDFVLAGFKEKEWAEKL